MEAAVVVAVEEQREALRRAVAVKMTMTTAAEVAVMAVTREQPKEVVAM